MLSKPMMERSSGTRMPRAFAAFSAPTPMRSLQQKTAVASVFGRTFMRRASVSSTVSTLLPSPMFTM